jgi:hypothetical protein
MEFFDEVEAVRVICRVSPSRHSVKGPVYPKSDCISVVDDQQLKLISQDASENKNNKEKIFRFCKIFTIDATQVEVYEDIADVVSSTIKGYNATIFAYGAYGAGKSYTMFGNNNNSPGIIPRAIENVFVHINNSKREDLNAFFNVEISFIELYHNSYRNLLKPITDELARLEVTEDENISGSELDDLLEKTLSSAAFEGFLKKRPDLSYGMEKVIVVENALDGVYLNASNLRISVKDSAQALKYTNIGLQMKNLITTASDNASSR